jgi:leucyl/phenylalanyl-tRNA---protein transferase
LTQLIRRYMPKNIRKQIRRVADISVNTYYGWFARQLARVASDDFTGETYLFEAQPYSVDSVLRGYALGVFATPNSDDGAVQWYDPQPRAVLPIQDFHVPQHLQTLMQEGRYEVCVDEHFRQIVEQCLQASLTSSHVRRYVDVWTELHTLGHAHAVGVWENDELIGGRFGLAFGGYFTEEGSFQKDHDAADVTLIRLAEILAAGNFILHDTRRFTPHITQFGGHNISRDEFHKRHAQAIVAPAQFDAHAIFTQQNSS